MRKISEDDKIVIGQWTEKICKSNFLHEFTSKRWLRSGIHSL